MNSSTLNSIAPASALALFVLFPNSPALADGCPAPDFVSFHTFETGAQPSSVAVGDFNGDSKPDLAVAIDEGVAVLLGAGNSAFEAAVHYRTGSDGTGPHASFVAVGDFNADGKFDLVVANQQISGNVSVLLGRGDGTFQTATNYEAGIYPLGVALGDFNGDRKPDLAVVNEYSADLHVLLGNGDGTLQTNVTISLGGEPTSIAAGDFNGDGKLDLAVGNGGSWGNNLTDSGLEVLIGHGDGTFHAAVHYRTGVRAWSVAVGDFNGDRVSDLTVANYRSGDVSVLLGRGDGTFNAAVNYDTGKSPRSVAVGDFNRDGDPDLAVVNEVSDDISILLNNGDGTFQAAVHFGAGKARSVAVGDFNQDGKADLAATWYNGDRLVVLLGNGDGSFQAAPVYRAGGDPAVMAVADFNGDAKPDLAVAAGAGDWEPGSVSVLLGQRDGTFRTAGNYPVGGAPNSLAVADFNGNGQPDLAVVDRAGVAVLLAESGGDFQPAVRYSAGNAPHSLAVGDFNGDRAIDLAVANPGPSTNGSVSILPGRGDGTFGSAVSHALNTLAVAVVAGDFNGDGKLDLVVANAYVPAGCPDIFGGPSPTRPIAESSLSVLLGQGDGTFQAGLRFDPGGAPQFLRTGDLNGDGILDLVGVNPSIPYPPCGLGMAGNLAVLLGIGDGNFQPAVPYDDADNAAARHPRSVVITDFNQDGAQDLISANYSTFGCSLRFGKGDGTFHKAITFAAGSPALSVAVADFNVDGKFDVALAGLRSGVLMLLNTCTNSGIKLDVTRIDNAITLSWPLPYTHFVLESATHFLSPNWQALSGVVKTNNGRCEVTAPLDPGQRYFRLRRT